MFKIVKLFTLVFSIFLAGCDKGVGVAKVMPIFEINNGYSSVNYNNRIRQIVLHHTVSNFEESLKILDGQEGVQVSSHYLINDHPNETYPDYIYNLVPEEKRSWHAGISQWGYENDINTSSIGIEIVNADGNLHAYPNKQIEAVIFLLKDLIKRHEIEPVNVIGHSDIAPGRKIDPGILFPWKLLYENGIGAWYEPEELKAMQGSITQLPPIAQVKKDLHKYGYAWDMESGDSQEYEQAVMAFKRHFNPENLNKEMSLVDYQILKVLLKKYRSK
jgi:N-acetylmuramoyl-L-alanine amidase